MFYVNSPSVERHAAYAVAEVRMQITLKEVRAHEVDARRLLAVSEQVGERASAA
jgi:hypothetical protein